MVLENRLNQSTSRRSTLVVVITRPGLPGHIGLFAQITYKVVWADYFLFWSGLERPSSIWISISIVALSLAYLPGPQAAFTGPRSIWMSNLPRGLEPRSLG